VGEGSPGREDAVRAVNGIGSACVVRLQGELDLYTADRVRSALGDAAGSGPQRVVVDLAHVEFVDSTMLGVLVAARSALPEGAFRLAAPQLEVRRALMVSGLDRTLLVHETVDEALAAD
jgi:anti-sigma B factor antagonist